MKSNNSPKIGAYVLESLTTGMYTRPLDAIREYIQNSADSIRKAEEEGLVGDNQGRIDVTINKSNRTLTIKDNGSGISVDDIFTKLLDIGMSSKDIKFGM